MRYFVVMIDYGRRGRASLMPSSAAVTSPEMPFEAATIASAACLTWLARGPHFARDHRKLALAIAGRFDRGVEQVDLAGCRRSG